MAASSSRVVLLYGGTWDEREVSIESATPIDRALRNSGLEVVRVRWDRDGWTVVGSDAPIDGVGKTQRPLRCLEELVEEGVGVVFNALHGGAGEDGTVSSILEVAGVPYTGASPHDNRIKAEFLGQARCVQRRCAAKRD